MAVRKSVSIVRKFQISDFSYDFVIRKNACESMKGNKYFMYHVLVPAPGVSTNQRYLRERI